MEFLIKKRPILVTVIGWFFIISAGLGILSSIVLIFLRGYLPRQLGFNAFLFGFFKEAFTPLMFAFVYAYPLAVFELLFAISMLVASIQFLRLRAWGRTALEVVTYINLCQVVTFILALTVPYVKMSLSLSLIQGNGILSLVLTAFTVLMLVSPIVFWTVFYGAIIKLLREKTVREACSKPGF